MLIFNYFKMDSTSSQYLLNSQAYKIKLKTAHDYKQCTQDIFIEVLLWNIYRFCIDID